MQKHTILFLAANPGGTDRLALDREARAIEVELERSGYRDCFELKTRLEDPVPDQCRSQPTMSWVYIWRNADAHECPSTGSPEVGSVSGSVSKINPKHVKCRRQGKQVSIHGQHNHWWLWMDLDAPSDQQGWISAYYIKDQGNNQADNICTGQPIPDCPPGECPGRRTNAANGATP